MTMTQEWAEKIWRGGPEAFQIVRGLYADMVSKMDGFEQQAKLLLDACEKIPLVWIPIEERLPEIDRDVLLTDGEEVVLAWLAEDGWQTWDASQNWRGPRAWMPLPEPPKK